MNQYKSLLILGMSLNLLTGCSPPMMNGNSDVKTHEVCESRHFLFPAHLKASREALKSIDVEQVSHALSDHKPIINYVMQRCIEENIPLDFALIPVLESYYNPRLIQEGNAGIWQLNPVLAQNLSLSNNYWFDARKDIVLSTDAVIAYVKFLHYKLEQDWTLTLAAYHAGLQPILDAVNYSKSLGHNPTIDNLKLDSETTDFIKQLQSVIYLAQHTDIQSSNKLHIVSLPGQIELEKLAEVSDIQYEKLEYLNTGFKRPMTDPQGPHRIVVDAEDYNAVLAVTKDMNKLRKVSKSNWSHHIVKKNENLSLIAHRYETNISEIKRVNNLHSNIITINQKLIIPDSTSQPKAKMSAIQNNHPGPKRILHTVSSHDTLYHISSKYHTPIPAISQWNNLKNNSIHPDQTLTIWQYTPVDTAKFYTVKSDDSLTKIAKLHKVSVAELKKANHLKNDIIHPKDRLLIPTSH